MPRPRFFKLPQEKRSTILDAAEAEFIAHGLSAASYNTIISSAGISKGAAYYYFDDKADVFAAVVERRFEGFGESVGNLGEVSDPASFWSEVEALFGRVAEFLEVDPRRLALAQALAAASGTQEGLHALNPLYEATRNFTQDVLQTGQAVSAVRSDLPLSLLTELTLAIGETADRWLASHIETLDDGTLGQHSAKTLDLMARVVAPSPEP